MLHHPVTRYLKQRIRDTEQCHRDRISRRIHARLGEHIVARLGIENFSVTDITWDGESATAVCMCA
jgi:hypothetical protein